MHDDYAQARETAADLAVRTLAILGSADTQTARSWSDFWLGYVLAHESASVTTAVSVKNAQGKVYNTLTAKDGATMATEMTMDDTITLVAAPADDHGDPTSDAITFASDDNGAVLSWDTAGDTSTGTPVGEGVANVTVSDPSAPSLQPTVISITVGPGPTSQIQVTATVNTGANAAPTA
jgi:hypothetical protein